MKKLNQLEATALSGNDTLSSVLYISALTVVFAGKYAWISILIVGIIFFLYKKMYSNISDYYLFNGGVYNISFLNSGKLVSIFTAIISLLTFLTITTISVSESTSYLGGIIPDLPNDFYSIVLVSIIFIFSLIGVKITSKFSVLILIVFLLTILIVFGFGFFFLFENGFETLFLNFNSTSTQTSPLYAIILGFTNSIIVISGLESASNYVEQQQKNIYKKVFNNIWLLFIIPNLLIVFLALSVVKISDLQSAYNQNILINQLANLAIGQGFSMVIKISSFLILFGAAISSFFGAIGLLYRLIQDSVITNFSNNKMINRIIISFVFYVLSVNLLVAIEGNIMNIVGLFSISLLLLLIIYSINFIVFKSKQKILSQQSKLLYIGIGFITAIAVVYALYSNINYYLQIKGSLLTTLIHYSSPVLIKGKYIYAFTSNDIVKLKDALNYFNQNNLQDIKIVFWNNMDQNEEQINTIIKMYPNLNIETINLDEIFSFKSLKELSEKLKVKENQIYLDVSKIRLLKQNNIETGDVRFIMEN